MQKGKVFLIGAGPGDPQLFTLKGKECLEKSQIIVFDRLANPRLLEYANPQAERIFVGKEADRHTLKQSEINQLLVDKAKQGYIVARLKGGDPFVFGRGGEEAEALIENGLEFEVVPGITSAIAVPAYAGIPVTHRGFNSTLTIVTGHEDPYKTESSIEWPQLAGLSGTLVFLMGLEKLPEITRRLIEEGKSPDTPAAIIQWGTYPNQKVVTATLEDIVSTARQNGLTPPVITVVGEVVKLRERLNWFDKRPFFGKRIVVTRAREQASILSQQLEELGAEVIEFPTIEIQRSQDLGLLDEAIHNLHSYQWVIFTSVNGVQIFFDRLWELGLDLRELAGIRLVAIGPATEKKLTDKGLRTEFVPSEYRAEAIIEGMQRLAKAGERVLLPRAREARMILPLSLDEMGLKVDEITIYDTLPTVGGVDRLKEMLGYGQIDYITFTSSSTVKNFREMMVRHAISESMLQGVKIAAIGPITADTVKTYGMPVDVLASEFTIEGLVNSLLDDIEQNGEKRVDIK